MNREATVELLFDISKEIKRFYETPVIFVTKQDYSDMVFNAMCNIQSTFQDDQKKSKTIDIIIDFHLHWLHAINYVENFTKRIHYISREEMCEAVNFTIDAMSSRLKKYQNYIHKHLSSLSNQDQANLLADVEIIEEMHEEIMQNLAQKLKCFRSYVSNDEFILKLKDSVDQLLHWIDNIHDGLSIQLSRYVNVNIPHFSEDLMKTLQQIVDSFKNSKSPAVQSLLKELKNKGKQLGSMIHCTTSHDLEICKVVEKIRKLEDRIVRLESEQPSAAVMALQNKKLYLERRLSSLENIKTTLKLIQEQTNIEIGITDEELCSCKDFYQLRIFNHDLPLQERERLVTELCNLWDLAVRGEHSLKSIISILSAADTKEEYTDELGTFYVDEHSRKIYKQANDDTLFQPNENNVLIPISDDKEHVYFYDECGRYFIDQKTCQRIYKAHDTASEYMMDNSGKLLKVKEEYEGVTYYYDNYGRYYINEDGKHIYREVDTASEYENDGLGNLVRIRSQLDIFKVCPDDVNVTEDFKYLKLTVGKALRECIADVILHQPADPIKYLSARLIKYRENMELREKRTREKEELYAEREIKITEERAAMEKAAAEAALQLQGGSETSFDSNLLIYNSLQPDDTTIADTNSK